MRRDLAPSLGRRWRRGCGGRGVEKRGEGRHTCDIVYAIVDYDIHALFGGFMSCYVGCGEGFRHLEYVLVIGIWCRCFKGMSRVLAELLCADCCVREKGLKSFVLDLVRFSD